MDSKDPNPEEVDMNEAFSDDDGNCEEKVASEIRKLAGPGTSTKKKKEPSGSEVMDSEDPNPEEVDINEAFSVDAEDCEEKMTSEIRKLVDLSVPGTCTNEKKEPSGRMKIYIPIVKFIIYQESIFASLLNDYVESNVFIIDGDSLLLSCAFDKSLKKGQSLHFFFLVECFLLNLKDKGARYVVVFFEDMEQTYSQCPVLKSWRTQLKIHLQKNTNSTVYTFQNFLSPQWISFLRDKFPYFLMVSNKGITLEQTCFLNMLMLDSLGNNINVVLTAGLESDQLRIYGYFIRSSLRAKSLIEKVKKNFAENLQIMITLKKFNSSKRLFQLLSTINCKEQVQKCISLLTTHQKDVRAITCVVACSMALRIHAESNPMQDKKKRMSLEEASDLCKMQCLCVALMITIPLSQRARLRKLNAKWNRNVSSFIHMYTICKEFVLAQMGDDIENKTIDWTYVSDISDHLLLKNIVYYCEKEVCKEFKLEFGNEINQLYKSLWDAVSNLAPPREHLLSYEFRETSIPFLSQGSSIQVEKKYILPVGLIPIRSDVIEEYAGDMIKELTVLSSDDPRIPTLMNTKTYDELLHWHTDRPLSDDYDRTKCEDKAKDKDSLKGYQKLQTFQYRYGKSLGLKTPRKIILQSDQLEEKGSAQKAVVKKKEPQKKKKDQIREENLKKSKAKEEEKEQEQWKNKEITLQKEVMEDFSSGFKKLDDLIRSFQTPRLKYQASLRALKLCFDKWTEECEIKSKELRDINIVVEIMKMIQTVMISYQDLLQKEDQHRIATYLCELGFDNLASLLRPAKLLSNKKEEPKGRYAVGVGSARFQLQYMGPHLLRENRHDPDPRVLHFIPDTWQRELLDAVDKNESAVIVAPTSSGKTYASYYCMQKVLTQSNEAVVVYVAPTKALVNQVVATVISQFDKDLPKGMALCGVFTRDYRTDALNSQVLVTVPQCLEILLLSPHRQEWVKRIKYVILDEVHCLGGEKGAETWDHILSMIRCPFLALSATISNPEHLTGWLQSVQKYWQRNNENEMSHISKSSQKGAKKKTTKTERRSYNVRLVQYDKRYNDLEKYICSVEDADVNFEHLHPFASLTLDHMKNYGIPKDLTFSPRESIKLFDCMVDAWPNMPNLKALDPEENIHLKDKIITKKDATEYEETLKKEFSNWVQEGDVKEVSKVLESLRTKDTSEVDCYEYFPLLVEQLDKMNKLPAIFFAFELNLVENLAKILYMHLSDKRKMKETENGKKYIQKLEAKAEKLGKSLQATHTETHFSRTSSKSEEQMIKQANYDNIMKKIAKYYEMPSDCTYAVVKAVDKETLLQIYKRTKYSRHNCLIPLSRKGIGYHHGSVDAKGRGLVEMLFRMGYIRVVTATSSLALGINMPCKSVVFLKDSPYLDALNYRQMAGRAGRRGHDLVGNVYFFNIPMPKVKRLLKSNVPELKGQFPLSISLMLRLMLLSAKADDKKDAKTKVLSLLMHPLMSFKRPQEEQVLKLYCIFSLQFLLFEGYLNQDCEPSALTGLVSHLHYHEPSNFVFVRFLQKGLFHQLCKPSINDSSTFPDSVMETLVLILAHLFGRRYLPPNTIPGEKNFFQSKVFLEELPDDFASVVDEHNCQVANTFGQCILACSKLADMKKEQQLPLSKINFAGEEFRDSGLVNHLMSCCEGRRSVNLFACLSGNTDNDLMDMRNLNSLMMQTAQIPEKYIPVLPKNKMDISGEKKYLNAYALDFFKHGSMTAIAHENRFNSGEARYVLWDFYLTIASISVSLNELCDTDPVARAFEQLRSMYHEKLEEV